MPKQFGLAGFRAPLASPALLKRREQAAVRRGSAREALSGLKPNSHIFGLTAGQFSMIDLASAALDIAGTADIGLWTWCIAEYEVEAMSAFLADGRVNKLRLVMDYSGARRDMPLIGELQEKFGIDCIRATKTHAKIVLVANDVWQIVIRGSMNLNNNPRFEQFDVSDGPEIYGVVSGLMDELWERTPALPVRKMTSEAATESFGLVGIGISQMRSSAGDKNWWRR